MRNALFFVFIRLYIRTLTQVLGCCMIFLLYLFFREAPRSGSKAGKILLILSFMPRMRKGGIALCRLLFCV